MLRKIVVFLFILLVLIFVTLYLVENHNNDASVSDTSFGKDSRIVLVDDSNSSNVNSDVAKSENIKEPRVSDSALNSLIESEMDLHGGFDSGIVSDENVVDSAKLNSILASADFYEIIDALSVMPDKSFETIVFESSISEFLNNSKYSSILNEYRVSCDNKICFGYFTFSEPDGFAHFYNDFILSNNSPMNKSGYVNYLMVTNNAKGVNEYRISFNSDPLVKSITAQK